MKIELKSIEEDAREYCKGSPQYLFEHRGYMAGATAQGNKIIEEALRHLYNHQNTFIDKKFYRSLIYELEKLKV